MPSSLVESGLSDTFFRDVGDFERVPIEALSDAAKLLNKGASEGDLLTDQEAALAPVATAHNIASEDLARVLRAALYILSEVRAKTDTTHAVAQALAEMGKVTDATALKTRLDFILKALDDRVFELELESITVGSAFPVIDYLDTNVTLAFSFGKGFNPVKDRASTYKPHIYAAIPLVLVQLDIGRFGSRDRVSFAVTEDELLRLINTLDLAHKELEAVKASHAPSRKH
jgi:hypothetical protein